MGCRWSKVNPVDKNTAYAIDPSKSSTKEKSIRKITMNGGKDTPKSPRLVMIHVRSAPTIFENDESCRSYLLQRRSMGHYQRVSVSDEGSKPMTK